MSLKKTNESDFSAPFLDLDLSLNSWIIASKIYDKRDAIVNYPHLDGDSPCATSYGVYISQHFRFARACSSVEDFHIRKRTTTEKKLLKQGYRFNKLRKTFSKFYYRKFPLISKYKCNWKYFLRQGISHPVFYSDVIHKLRKMLRHVHFEHIFNKRIESFIKKDYDPVILQRTSRLVIDPSTVNSHAFLFGCAVTDRV